MKLVTKDLTQTKVWLSSHEHKAVMKVIESSFSNVVPEVYFAKYFEQDDAFKRKLRLYLDNDKVVGFCLITFSSGKSNKDLKVVMIKACAAFIPQYRRGGNTFTYSLYESFKYWLSAPWKKIYYADTMLSPAMYRAIAKNVGVIWPHPNHSTTNALFELFNAKGEFNREESLRCLMYVGRVSKYSDKELASFEKSKKLEIEYYCKLNPDFNKGIALFVIIPVHFKQLLQTAYKMYFRSK